MAVKRIEYDYETFTKDLYDLAESIPLEFDAIVAVARGGMTMAHMLAELWGIRKVFIINAIGYEDTEKRNSIEVFNTPDLKGCEKILVVDDIADSGETLFGVIGKLEAQYPEKIFKTATIFFKPDARFEPDFKVKKADAWIDFFWSEDLKRYNGVSK